MQPKNDAARKHITKTLSGLILSLKSLSKAIFSTKDNKHKRQSPASAIVGKKGELITVKNTPNSRHLKVKSITKTPPKSTINVFSGRIAAKMPATRPIKIDINPTFS